MIDIHHHCLPGIDDGPMSWEESIDQCRRAADDGITDIIATPHVLRGRWPSPPPERILDMTRRLAENAGAPTLHPGSEYFFAHDMAEILQAGGAIVPLAGSRYVLVEFASSSVPPLVESVLFRVQIMGWIPIIAHPERNRVFQSRPDLLASIISKGGKSQLTAMSLTGAMGKPAEKFARMLLEAEMVHFVATDAHDTTRRPPGLAAAREIVRRAAGEWRAEALTAANGRAVLRDEPLPYDPEPRYPLPKSGFFHRLRGLLR